jgi:hypothetical protein
MAVPQAAGVSAEKLEPSPPPTVWRAIWAVYGAAFVAAGFLGLGKFRERIRVTSYSERSSTDTVFLKTLGVENASRRIADCLKDVPQNEPVAVVYQNAAIAELDALLLGSLAWPRPIPQFPLGPGQGLENDRLVEAKATRAIFFLGMPRPNASEHIRSLAPLMHFYRSPALPRSE